METPPSAKVREISVQHGGDLAPVELLAGNAFTEDTCSISRLHLACPLAHRLLTLIPSLSLPAVSVCLSVPTSLTE